MDTVAHLHDAQQRADRAAAARKAAEHLRQVTARHCDPAHGWAADTRSPVDMVMADFPDPVGTRNLRAAQNTRIGAVTNAPAPLRTEDSVTQGHPGRMEDLSSVLWIGGPPGAGKTTVARLIARRRGLCWYTTAQERRLLLRYANRAIVSQYLTFFARPWAPGDARTTIRAFACECGKDVCEEQVELTITDFPRLPDATSPPVPRVARGRGLRIQGASGDGFFAGDDGSDGNRERSAELDPTRGSL